MKSYSSCRVWLESTSRVSSSKSLLLLLASSKDIDIGIDGSRMTDGGRERELKREALPLSPPLAGPELSSLLFPTFTLDSQANVVMCADRPPTYPRLMVPPFSLSGLEIVLPTPLELACAGMFSCRCLNAFILDGRSG